MTEIQRGVYLLKAFQHDGCARTTRVANFRVELPLKFNRASDIMRHEIAFNPFAQRYIYIRYLIIVARIYQLIITIGEFVKFR